MAVLLAVLAAGPVLSCSTAFVGAKEVGPNFRVKAEDRGRPVQGIPVKLHVYSDVNDVRYQVVTDENGIARFHSLTPGSYFLVAGREPGFADAFNVEVKVAESSERTIPVRWPNATPLVIASLKGTLNPEYQETSHLSLELIEPLSGRILKSAETNENGAFDFPGSAPGLYFLRVTPPGGLIPVDVEPGAAAERLDLDLGFNGCGLQYVDRKQCPQPDLHLQRLAGRVIDETKAGFPLVEITLLGPGGKVVERTYSDRAGNFPSLHPPDGTYQLVIEQNGFTPLRATLTIDPNGASSSLEVQPRVLGFCSSARIQ